MARSRLPKLPKRTQIAPQDAKVDTPHPGYLRMLYGRHWLTSTQPGGWELGDDLLEGTEAMRARQDELYTPRYPQETDADYQRRVSMTVLFDGFKRAVTRNAVKPFSKPVRIVLPDGVESLPAPLDQIEHDTDGNGTDLTHLARLLLFDGVARGPAYILVDNATSTARNREEQEREGLRPRFRRIPPRDLFSWEVQRDANGVAKIVSVRITEMREERVGEWGVSEVPHIRVLTAPATVAVDLEDGSQGTAVQSGTVTIFRADAEGEFHPTSEPVPHDFPGLPLVVMQFGEQHGPVECEAPFADIRQINLLHWRSSSRQTQYTDVVRAASFWGSGLSQEDIDKGIMIQPGWLNGSKNEDAKVVALEHTGAAAAVGVEELQRLEDRMAEKGEEPMRQKSGDPTATGKAIDAAESNTTIEAWVRLVEKGLEQAYEHAARWAGVELPEGWHVDIWTEFSLELNRGVDIDSVIKLHTQGSLSTPTALKECQRRGLLAADLNIEEELDRIEEERERAAERLMEQARVEAEEPPPDGDGEPGEGAPPEEEPAGAAA